MSKRRADEVTTKLLSDKDTDLFIVPPTSSSLQTYYAEELLSGDQLKAIESKVVARSKILAAEKLHEIEAQLNEVIFQQVTKLKQWSDFLKDFTETYDLQAAEIEMMREEILAERVSISLKKSQP